MQVKFHLINSQINMNKFLTFELSICLSGREQEALDFLYQDVEKGFGDFTRLENDSDLEKVRELPEFHKKFLHHW